MKNLVLSIIIVAATFFWYGFEHGIAKTTIRSETDLNMPPTNFSGADLTGANLTGVRIDGVILCNTTMDNGTINNSSCKN